MQTITLNNDVKMPAIGLGTFMMQPAEAQAASESALSQGYRHIDTANAYLNERAVGRAIAASDVPREDVFVSTKLWPSVYATADDAIDATLARMGLGYVDMLILHQPVGDYLGAWKAMERAYAAGKVRSLGLSNFPKEQIAEVIEAAEVMPQLVTVESHPYFPQDDLRAYLDRYGIVIEAWYPLGHGDKALIEEPVFAQLAGKYGKTPAQVILRWHVQKGNSIIPGSKNPSHIADNADIFDFELTDDEMAAIADINKGVRYYNGTDEMLQGYLAWAPDFDAQE